MSRVASPRHGGAAAENEVYEGQLCDALETAMAERDPRRIQITRLKYGLEDGVEWTYPQLSVRFNQTASVLKGIVRTEVRHCAHNLPGMPPGRFRQIDRPRFATCPGQLPAPLKERCAPRFRQSHVSHVRTVLSVGYVRPNGRVESARAVRGASSSGVACA